VVEFIIEVEIDVDSIDVDNVFSSYISEFIEVFVCCVSVLGFGVVIGCCKEVVVCVCIVFGIGCWMINGCELVNYFFNKVY